MSLFLHISNTMVSLFLTNGGGGKEKEIEKKEDWQLLSYSCLFLYSIKKGFLFVKNCGGESVYENGGEKNWREGGEKKLSISLSPRIRMKVCDGKIGKRKKKKKKVSLLPPFLFTFLHFISRISSLE